mmetsp:Transcript_2602/g.5834  ORF Transcript_2602/g.5834 Transcript_2602/m.5834 type:complete len:153 (+) Transcript_2602:235-693(+)
MAAATGACICCRCNGLCKPSRTFGRVSGAAGGDQGHPSIFTVLCHDGRMYLRIAVHHRYLIHFSFIDFDATGVTARPEEGAWCLASSHEQSSLSNSPNSEIPNVPAKRAEDRLPHSEGSKGWRLAFSTLPSWRNTTLNLGRLLLYSLFRLSF